MQRVTRSAEEATDFPPFNFSAGVRPLYTIAPDATADDVHSMLTAKMAHLDAMLHATYGETGESFRRFNSQIQDEFMWSCGMISQECRELFEQLDARRAA